MKRGDIWHDGEKEKEARWYKEGREGRGGDVQMRGIRFAEICGD